MSGRAYNPQFLFAWPTAKIAVMGGEQAAKVLYNIKISKLGNIKDEQKQKIFNDIKTNYDKQSAILYGAARLWIDEVINPVLFLLSDESSYMTGTDIKITGGI